MRHGRGWGSMPRVWRVSRSKDCARCAQLEAELAQWKQDYKDLALAGARSEVRALKGSARYGPGGPQAELGGVFSAQASGRVQFTAEPMLPPTVLAAIDDTTAAFSESRTMAIEAAKALLEEGATPEQVEERLRLGDEIRV